MKKKVKFFQSLALTFLALMVWTAQVMAQPSPFSSQTEESSAPMRFSGGKPVMENVFFNVVWGSLFGAVLGAAGSVIQSPTKTAPENISTLAGAGATYGGVVGLGAGIWLAFSGISFDPQKGLFFGMEGQGSTRQLVAVPTPPVSLVAGPHGRIIGFRARVFQFRF